MELKQQLVIEIDKNGQKFSFVMPVGASYGACYDAAFQTLQEILALIQKASESARPKDPEIPDVGE